MPVQPIPDGYRTVTPYLTVRRLPRLLDFVRSAFGATIVAETAGPDGKLAHAEIRIGDSMVMAGEGRPEWPYMPGAIYLYVPDVDATYQQALKAGARSVMEVGDQTYGDRSGGVKDPCGNLWWISTHIEDLTREEIERRTVEAARQAAEVEAEKKNAAPAPVESPAVHAG